jgi:CheY-like chemotaxis protein
VLFYCLRKENTRGGVCIFPPSGDHRIYEHERGDTDHHGVSVWPPAVSGGTDCRCAAVLLAEDNALNAEVATELLGSLGLVVDWAENGSEAVDQFEASDPGSYFAIFMDMQMPVMEGIEATKKFETVCVRTMMFRFLRWQQIPLQRTASGARMRAWRGYIPKPVNLKEIQTTLDEKVRTACAG